MPSEIGSPLVYTWILVLLLVATVATVGISFLPLEGAWHIAIGLLIGLAKATLVVLFFMHALHSPRATWAVIVTAVTGLAVMLVLTLGDYLTRGEIPGMPGH